LRWPVGRGRIHWLCGSAAATEEQRSTRSYTEEERRTCAAENHSAYRRAAEETSQSHRSGRIARPVWRVGRVPRDARGQENLFRVLKAEVGHKGTLGAHA